MRAILLAVALTGCLAPGQVSNNGKLAGGKPESAVAVPAKAPTPTASSRSQPDNNPKFQVVVAGSTFVPFSHAPTRPVALKHDAVPISDWHAEPERVSPIGSRKQLPIGKPNYRAWAELLVQIHNRVHPIFADQYLSSLDALPSDSPLNDMNLAVQVELQILQSTGDVEAIGVRQRSGREEFDIAAMAAFWSAFPIEIPPALASPDGRVYILWEVRRDKMACSTLFAHPFRFQ